MKKWISLLLSLLLLGAGVPLAQSRNAPAEISTREELARIADNPGGDYVLVSDIDLGGAPWTPIPFSGTLDGAGHTIGNLTVVECGVDTATTFDGNRRQYETSFAGLFSVATGAKIGNLTLLNAKIDVKTDRNCFVAAIAGYAAETTVENCTVTTRATLTISSQSAGVGGVIGFSDDCVIDGCRVEAELVFVDVNPDVLCEEFLGGVYASGYGTVRSCSVFTRGYADIYGYAHNGGVIGMYKLPRNPDKRSRSVRDTSVDAELRFFEVTPSHRAYSDPIIGEDGAKDCYLTHNQVLHFDSTFDRDPNPKRPETCESPDYSAVVTEPTCSSWGYTTYTCAHCGYTFRDDFVFPCHGYDAQTVPATCTAEGKTTYTCRYCGESHEETIPPAGHTPGEWTVTKEAALNEDGEETLFCTVCGDVLETRAIPALQPTLVRRIVLDDAVIELSAGETVQIEVSVEPQNATDAAVLFESSDPAVAAVDATGRLTGVSAGTAVITVTSADGGARAAVSVMVTPTDTEKKENNTFLMRCG